MKYLKMMSVLILALTMVNCSDDDIPSPVADFTADVDGTEVTFTSQMSEIESFEWNFDDGNKSIEANPVHAYREPGTYKVALNIVGKDGSISAVTHNVEVQETISYLLTGGAANPDGKIWKINPKVSNPVGAEGSGAVVNSLVLDVPIDEDGFLDWISLPQGYNDTFTFVYDGAYKVDNSDTFGGSIMSLVYAVSSGEYDMKSALEGGDILGMSTQLGIAPLGDIKYTPKTDATWSLSDDDFTIDALNTTTGIPYTETFTGKKHLILSEYIVYKDTKIEVIIKSINKNEMNVAIALYAAEAAPNLATHMVHLTLVAQ